MRLLLLIVAIWVGIMVVRHFLHAHRQAQSPRELPEQDMVRCAQCGVHLPKREALQTAGHFYCCDRHRLQGPARDR